MAEPGSRERAVIFSSAGLDLAGTLTRPTSGERPPIVLLLPGSGQTDRDDNARALAINAFPAFVQALDGAGLATFRYDKRGVGASPGDYWRTGFDERLADAGAAIDWLRIQPDLDSSRIFVLGHSEGALLAVRLAAGGAPVAGLVLLAGSAKTGEQTLRWQGARIAASITRFPGFVLRVLHIDPLRAQDKAIARIRATDADTLRIQLVNKINARWMREFIAYDPEPDLAAIRVPVLAITGSKDLQVDPADLDRMARLITGPFESHEVPDVTHLLRADSGRPSLQTYRRQVKQPVDPRVLDYVSDWLKKRAEDPTA
ncbi:MAG: alpha/beta hydrolase [Betaproteobacteria bacterium]